MEDGIGGYRETWYGKFYYVDYSRKINDMNLMEINDVISAGYA